MNLSERLNQYLDKRPKVRLIGMVFLSFVFLVFGFFALQKMIILSFNTQTVVGHITKYNHGTKSSSYNYEYKVQGKSYKDKAYSMIPFMVSFYVGEQIDIVVSTSDPSISVPDRSFSHDYLVGLLIVGICLITWSAAFKFATKTAIEDKVSKLDHRAQIAEFERQKLEEERTRSKEK